MSGLPDVQVVRQPIFDAGHEVWNYELLFRSGVQGLVAAGAPEAATAGVISTSLFGIGVDDLVGDRRGFINFPSRLLVDGTAGLLSPDRFAIEILRSVPADADVIATIAHLHENDFLLALDDFRADDHRMALLEHVDLVKIDFLDSEPEDRALAAKVASEADVPMAGYRIETRELHAEAESLGCTLFQGHFYAEPEIVPGAEVPGSKITQLRVLREVSQPVLAMEELNDLIRHDVGLTYKLLKYINSSVFGWKSEILSVRQALVLLGELEVRKWVTLAAIAAVGVDQPLELAVNSVVRARLCELLAEPLGVPERAGDLFFTGMLSHLDAMVGRSMETALEDVCLADDVRDALLGGEDSSLPASLLAMVRGYERADWDLVGAVSQRLGLSEAEAPLAYLEAVEFGKALLDL